MITRTEKEYRAVQMDSSSSLKEFSVDRKKYHKKYILGEKVEDDENKAAVMGRVVETLLLEPELFESRFHMSTCEGAPTGLMNDFVEALYKRTLEATDVFGKVARTFEEISKDAYVDSGFKIKYEAVMNKFAGSEAETYYDEIRVVRAKGLTVVTANDMNNAERIVAELRNNFVTRDVVNLVKSSRYDVYNQYQVEGFDVLGLQCKGMMDKIIVDHEAKTLQIYDLKCTWSVENFYEEYYLYRRAYIQAFLYWHAAHFHFKELVDQGYRVEYPQFIVCDSTNYLHPLVYKLETVDMVEAREGFTYDNKKYPGVLDTINDLKWAIENDTWNISRKNHLSQGIVNIKG